MRHFQSLLHNRELHVISHTKQPAVQEKAARSVCPKAGPEQQLLITEVQAKRALHSPGVHWEPGMVNRLLYTWRTCQSSSICVCVYIIIFYCYFDNMNIFFILFLWDKQLVYSCTGKHQCNTSPSFSCLFCLILCVSCGNLICLESRH